MSILIGLDCGGMKEGVHAGTGLTLFCADTFKVISATRETWDEWELANNINYYMTSYDVDLIVYETFVPRWGQKFELDTVYLNGALKATVDPDLLVGVAPSAHKSLIKRDWAKSLVLEAGYKVDQGHPVDGTSLVLYYLVVNRNPLALKEMKKWKASSK